jgi:hypothetical protein
MGLKSLDSTVGTKPATEAQLDSAKPAIGAQLDYAFNSGMVLQILRSEPNYQWALHFLVKALPSVWTILFFVFSLGWDRYEM